MDFRDYLARTDTTAIYPGAGTGSLAALVYVGLGLAGESSEVVEKELAGDLPGVSSELGDVAWYMSRLHRELGVDPDDTYGAAFAEGVPALVPAVHLTVAAGRTAELLKKAVRDDASAITDARKDLLRDQLHALVATWVGVNLYHGLDPHETLAANVAKLADRKHRGVLTGAGDHR